VHAIEYGRLDGMRTARPYVYRFAAKDFRPFEDQAFVAEQESGRTRPGVPDWRPVALHDDAGIELRIMTDLWPFVGAVAASTLELSGIRRRNARPKP
jgi:uncharacterized protein DUF6886